MGEQFNEHVSGVIETIISDQEEFREQKPRRTILSGIILCSYLCLGWFRSLPGPTLYILKGIAGDKGESIMMIFTVRSFGYLLGYVIGGAAFDYISTSLRKRMVILIVQLFYAACAFSIPFCVDLGTLCLSFFTAGFCYSVLETGFNTYMLQLWGIYSNPYFMSLHFFFGAGSFLAPLMAKIFVENGHTMNGTVSRTYGLLDMGTPHFPAILYTYVSLATFSWMICVMWFATLFCAVDDYYTHPRSSAKIKVPTIQFTIFAALSTCLLTFLTGSIDFGYQHLLATYAAKEYFGTVDTIQLSMIFWGFFAVGSAVSIVAAFRFHPFFMILMSLFFELSAGGVLLFLAEDDKFATMFGHVLLGLGASSLWAWSVLWLERYIIVTYKIVSVLLITATLAEMIVPQVLTLLLKVFSRVLNNFVIFVPIAYFIIFAVQCFYFFPYGEKYLSLSDLPNLKRDIRYFPVFLGTTAKEYDEEIVRHLQKRASDIDMQKAFLVAKSEEEGSTHNIYLKTPSKSKSGAKQQTNNKGK